MRDDERVTDAAIPPAPQPDPLAAPGVRRAVLTVAGLNAAYGVLAAAVAVAIGSVSLLADSADFGEDAAINVLIAVALSWPLARRATLGRVLAGVLLVPAADAAWSAFRAFPDPQPPAVLPLIATAGGAALVNGACALVLLRAGREHRSITLTADGKHLMTDVVTSAGVVVGVALVWLSGLQWLDPVVALLVGLNIIVTGWKLLQESADGLMDISLPKEDNARISEALGRFVTQDVHFHGLRTREAGHRRYAEVHVLVPGSWTVTQGHDLVEDVEAALREELPDVTLVCHLEPNDDPRSYDDYPTEFPVPDHAEMQRRAGVDGAS